ncbi:MAG: ammonia-forming cytochrome c nitrite reductase subunit c552 [Thermodesulfovibrionales bacterium]|nr:ammonia-forming cytochrome c nitrite reductase subunit c552 [Thermodesulfovibrionales bacterium]
MSKRYLLVVVLVVLSIGFFIVTQNPAEAQKSKQTQNAVKVDTCYACHSNIKDFHSKGKHAKVNCVTCHEGTDNHLKSPTNKPVTKMDHATCGSCHKEQYESFVSNNLHSKARVEKATFKSRSPLFDKLMMPHGFTKEHAEPRSHVFMLVDHLLVDRAYGGRFQLKDWTKISDAKSAEKDAWSIITDKEPSSSDQKTFLPQTFTAANPVCFQCKTQDMILNWAYMGDKNPKAKWDRTSKVVDFAREMKRPVNCFACHDPHSAKPRIVRDGLIEAIVDRGEGTYPYDKEKSKKVTVNKIMFRDYRAIGILNKPDSNIMCAQCHVEYNCNPGHNPETGEAVTMADRRTNLFQWVNVFDYNKVMAEKYKFKDFKHAITGASLSKIQHPEVETFWGSKHERAGVECKDCHMPRVKTKDGKKTYTWHGQRSARYMLKDTCTKCHSGWSTEEAEYQVEAIQSYIKGKLNKAEFWLGQFIDTFAKAKSKGVSEDVLKEARALHNTAHTYWEWWTAENSDGFHNPEAARESLTRSIDASQKGIKLLNDAMAKK